MIWQTSPAAAELEERMMQWLAQMLGLPEGLEGVIQDTASTATLCSILTAREKDSSFQINERGFDNTQYTLYCSTETHSSIEKAVKIAGLGRASLRKIPVDDAFAMLPVELEQAIAQDKASGYVPLCVVATIGTTGSTAIDPIRAIGEMCRRHHVWLHVDAAYAGTALLLPEMRWMADGLEYADTFVFNPHKWMLTNFDCTAYYVRDKGALIRTFEILPEYLKTAEGDRVNNYRDWGIPLGRRFRALKLWFVIRAYGVDGLQSILRIQLKYAETIVREIEESPDFEMLAPAPLSLICFRFHPQGLDDPRKLNELNERLINRLNATGKLFLTHTKLRGNYTLRMVIAQTQVTEADVRVAWELIQRTARGL
jgi:aromatic-L-amino-acid decarboxylase